jgi:hypothetical protein
MGEPTSTRSSLRIFIPPVSKLRLGSRSGGQLPWPPKLAPDVCIRRGPDVNASVDAFSLPMVSSGNHKCAFQLKDSRSLLVLQGGRKLCNPAVCFGA